MSSADVDAYLERWLEGVPEEGHATRRKQIDVMPVAEHFPVVTALRPDRDGGVWAEIYPTPHDTTSTWLRFEGEEMTCRLPLPRSLDLVEGGRGWILGVARDELDVQRVELWDLVHEEMTLDQ